MAFNLGGGATGALGGAASGAALGSVFPGIGTAVGAGVGGLVGLLGGGLGGNSQRNKIMQQQLLRPEQIPLYNQAINAGLRPGAGGAFGTAADYYRNLLGNESQDFNAFAAPQMRQFNEEIIPNLSEQFAGMGSGGLSSSGFRNSAVSAGTDLAERLGQIRANLRAQGAAGLANIGQLGLQNFNENLRNTPQATFGENLAQGFGQILPSLVSSAFNRPQPSGGGNTAVGNNTSPYAGGNFQSSPRIGQGTSGQFNLPTFLGR
jgi:hypothetical protein